MGCLSSVQLVLGFYLIPSFGIYSSIASFCLICSFYFCALDRLCFLTLEKQPFVEKSYVFQQHSLLSSQKLYALKVSPHGLHGSFCCDGLTTVGGLVGVAGFL